MPCYTHIDQAEAVNYPGQISREILNETQGAVRGYKIGVTTFETETYLEPGVHDDQEGFYVIEGEGMARVGDLEFPIKAGSAYIAPTGVPHVVKKKAGTGDLRILWSHSADNNEKPDTVGYVHEDEVDRIQRDGHNSRELITKVQGAAAGYMIGVTEYTTDEYLPTGVHDDQEGFYVLAGEGMAKVGDEEFPIRPGATFIAPKGVPHTVKKNPGSPPVKLVWSHGAV